MTIDSGHDDRAGATFEENIGASIIAPQNDATGERREPAAPSDGGDWIKSTLGDVFAKLADQQAAAEAHAAACTARPCVRCERYVCRCGVPVDGVERCPACAAAAVTEGWLRPTTASIPARFRWATNPDRTELLARVKGAPDALARGLANPPSASLLFMGPTGAGKTSLAVAMLDAWVRLDPPRRTGAIFVEAAWLARARARHKLGLGEAPLVDEAMRAPLVLLDDLGQEREDRDGCITDIVYGRTNAELPTWVTCGLTTAEQTLEAFAARLSQRYDGGFVRRILENGKRVQLGGAR